MERRRWTCPQAARALHRRSTFALVCFTVCWTASCQRQDEAETTGARQSQSTAAASTGPRDKKSIRPRSDPNPPDDHDWLLDPVWIDSSGKPNMKFNSKVDLKLLASNVSQMREKVLKTGSKERANLQVSLSEIEHYELVPKNGRGRVMLLFTGDIFPNDGLGKRHFHGYAIVSFAEGRQRLDDFKNMSVLDPIKKR